MRSGGRAFLHTVHRRRRNGVSEWARMANVTAG